MARSFFWPIHLGRDYVETVENGTSLQTKGLPDMPIDDWLDLLWGFKFWHFYTDCWCFDVKMISSLLSKVDLTSNIIWKLDLFGVLLFFMTQHGELTLSLSQSLTFSLSLSLSHSLNVNWPLVESFIRLLKLHLKSFDFISSLNERLFELWMWSHQLRLRFTLIYTFTHTHAHTQHRKYADPERECRCFRRKKTAKRQMIPRIGKRKRDEKRREEEKKGNIQ